MSPPERDTPPTPAAGVRRIRRSCPLCGRDNSGGRQVKYSQDDWCLRECRGCSLVYLENAVDYDALRDDFAWEKTFAVERERRRTRGRVRGGISGLLKSLKYAIRGGHHVKVSRYVERFIGSGRILDVGCGAGRTIEALGDGFEPYGIEISPHLAEVSGELCRARGGDVVNADAVSGIDRFGENYFDGMVLRAFLEHEVQPAELLAGSVRVLRPGGVLIIKVPNYGSLNRVVTGGKWCGFRFPDHVNYFTPRTLRRIVEEAGYHVDRFGFFDRLPLSDNMWLVARKPEGTT